MNCCAQECNSGLEAIGIIPWGSHFCEFYNEQQDLLDTAIPYFLAGLRANEHCVWIVSSEQDLDQIHTAVDFALRQAGLSHLRDRLEIFCSQQWYGACGNDFRKVGPLWLAKEKEALAAGRSGLRISGDTAWLSQQDWADFMDYEAEVNNTLKDCRIVALCTYSLPRSSASEVLDVVRNHEFALARRKGEWELIESGALKKAKRALQDERDTLERRVRERTQMLQDAVLAREEFLAMLAHEWRNPLAPIRQANELIRMAAGGHSQIGLAADVIDRQVGQLTRQVDDLLDLSRIRKGKVRLRKQGFDAREAMQVAVQTIRPRVDAAGQHLELKLSQEPLLVFADRDRIVQVLVNLLDNARKYTPTGGRIRCEVWQENDSVVFSCKDTGRGIEPALLEHVFEMFFQGKQSLERPEGGLGIGLTLARSIVDQHSGNISIKSDGVGKGTHATISLPILERSGEPVRDLRVVSALPVSLPKKKILVVDDNKDNALMLSLSLEALGCEVQMAHDGESGYALFESGHFDFGLIDIGLPRVNGYDLAIKIQAHPRACRLIAITGYGQPQDRLRSLSCGFIEHMVKPVDFRKLASLLDLQSGNMQVDDSLCHTCSAAPYCDRQECVRT